MARSMGCPAARIDDHDELLKALDDLLPGLARRDEPFLLEVRVGPDPDFQP